MIYYRNINYLLFNSWFIFIAQALDEFVKVTLPRGERFTECDSSLSFSDVLEATWNDSKPTTPLFFILSSVCTF